MHSHAVDRKPEHFRGGLRDDRIAAGSYIRHVCLDRQNTTLIEPNARCRWKQQVVSEGSSNTHADQHVAFRARPRLAPIFPAEALSAEIETSNEIALRERALRIFRVHLGVVQLAFRSTISPLTVCRFSSGPPLPITPLMFRFDALPWMVIGKSLSKSPLSVLAVTSRSVGVG